MSRRGHGEGSIYQRKDGRWVGTVNLGWQDGKRRRKSFYGTTRREVAEALTTAQRDVQLGLTVARDERLTVAAYLDRWLRESAGLTTRAKTRQGYGVIVWRHLVPALGRTPLARLTPDQVQAMLNAKASDGLSPQSIRNIHAVLRRALNQGVPLGPRATQRRHIGRPAAQRALRGTNHHP